MSEQPDFVVTEKAMRPASSKRECFYCNQPIGGLHEDECVLIRKAVRVIATIEYDIEVPAHWDGGDIEFHRNDGSYCGSNIVDELSDCVDQLDAKGQCLCNHVTFKVPNDIGKRFLQE